MLPRIPKVKDFQAFVDAGRALSGLHLNYETVEPYPLDETRRVNADYRVGKMKYAKRGGSFGERRRVVELSNY